MTGKPSGPNPYFFLVGSHRSGTTLLRRMVEAHSRIAVAPETQWIPQYYKRRIGLTADGRVTGGLIARLMEHPKLRHLGVSPKELRRLLAPGEQPPYGDFVGRIFDRL